MASWGAALARTLAERMNERRQLVAEQAAQASENLERILAQRQAGAQRARAVLTDSADYLVTRGFSESEVSQLVERDPREVLRLVDTLGNNADLRAEDIRSVASFREDYTPEVPLSDLIQRATPAIIDIDEPDPAAREQNIFQRLFGLDTSADRDRFLRESNFGGYSGYDILASVNAGDYRERTGERLIDYANLPVAVSATMLREYRDGVEDTLTGIGAELAANRDLGDDISLYFEDIKDSPSAIQRALFDDTNAERYEATRPYRERLLEEMSEVYRIAPQTFDTPTFSTLGQQVGSYVSALDEEQAVSEAIPTDGAPSVGGGQIETTVLPPPPDAPDLGEATEDNAQELLDAILESEDNSFVIGGVLLTRNSAITHLTRDYGAERPVAGVETEGRSQFSVDAQTYLTTSEAEGIYRSVLAGLRGGSYGPGTGILSRGVRYFTSGDEGREERVAEVQEVRDTLEEKENIVLEIILTDEEARRLLRENPAQFLEEYSEQLSGE